MISEIDVLRSANLLIAQHGDDAVVRAAMHADKLLDQGDVAGAATWRRIVKAIETLQDRSMPPGAPIH